MLLHCLLLIENLRLLLTLSTVLEILQRHLSEVLTAEHVDRPVIALGCILVLDLVVEHKRGTSLGLGVVTIALIDGTHELRHKFVMMAQLAGRLRAGIDSFNVETT